MVVGLKDGIKLVGVAVIVCAAVLVSTLFLNYLCDVTATRALIDDADATAVALYKAQLATAKFSAAISGAGLSAIAVAALAFYIKLYIDKNTRSLGILKAMGYHDGELALGFWVFGLPVLVGGAVGFGLAFALMPTVYRSLSGDILPTVPVHFHASLLALVFVPFAVFSAAGCLLALRSLKRPVAEMLKGGKPKPAKLRKPRDGKARKDGKKERSFVFDMALSTLGSKPSLAVFVALAGFSFSSMTQMSLSMLDINSGDLAYMVLVIGIVLAFAVFIMAITSLVKANEKNVALMKAYGYGFWECNKAVFGGYRPVAYIGFAVGTGYQFGLLKMMTELMYSDVAGVGEYHFGVGIFFGVLAAFVVLYEAATLVFARRLIKTPVKEIMLET